MAAVTQVRILVPALFLFFDVVSFVSFLLKASFFLADLDDVAER